MHVVYLMDQINTSVSCFQQRSVVSSKISNTEKSQRSETESRRAKDEAKRKSVWSVDHQLCVEDELHFRYSSHVHIHVYVIVLHIKIASLLYTLNNSNTVLYGIAVVMCVYVLVRLAIIRIFYNIIFCNRPIYILFIINTSILILLIFILFLFKRNL